MVSPLPKFGAGPSSARVSRPSSARVSRPRQVRRGSPDPAAARTEGLHRLGRPSVGGVARSETGHNAGRRPATTQARSETGHSAMPHPSSLIPRPSLYPVCLDSVGRGRVPYSSYCLKLSADDCPLGSAPSHGGPGDRYPSPRQLLLVLVQVVGGRLRDRGRRGRAVFLQPLGRGAPHTRRGPHRPAVSAPAGQGPLGRAGQGRRDRTAGPVDPRSGGRRAGGRAAEVRRVLPGLPDRPQGPVQRRSGGDAGHAPPPDAAHDPPAGRHLERQRSSCRCRGSGRHTRRSRSRTGRSRSSIRWGRPRPRSCCTT